ncbi:JAB domain-containing protein [Scatolibacter rhodanostii]|uniref:JAB domain-containing protein n=1 Tax=Scatolibacter rhodanostii TaxID=2014781 RepID=UPI0013566968|nr:JAB domain-containing protein [Scatolibacter rhodanostii]
MQGYSFEGKNSEAVLAELLSYVIGETKTSRVAKSLLNRLGSFSNVLEAPAQEIAAIKGMTPEAAEFLKKLKYTTEYYLEDKVSGMQRVYDTESAVEILRPKFIDKNREIVALLLLDGRGRILYNGIVNEGSVSEVPIYIRRLVELCLRYDTYTAIIAHNHPSGNPLPSRNDINATRDLEFALNGIDVELTDHLIFAGMDYTSMKSSEWLDQIKEEVEQYKNALKKETMEQEEALFANRKRVKKERQ